MKKVVIFGASLTVFLGLSAVGMLPSVSIQIGQVGIEESRAETPPTLKASPTQSARVPTKTATQNKESFDTQLFIASNTVCRGLKVFEVIETIDYEIGICAEAGNQPTLVQKYDRMTGYLVSLPVSQYALSSRPEPHYNYVANDGKFQYAVSHEAEESYAHGTFIVRQGNTELVRERIIQRAKPGDGVSS